jgi:Effector Associated Constant Component 1
MTSNQYFLSVEEGSDRDADMQTRILADNLREIIGVQQADRIKRTEGTMDLGTIISVLATSGATIALAQGAADWLRQRRSGKLTIERDATTNSIKAIVENIDPDAAIRIVELIRDR